MIPIQKHSTTQLRGRHSQNSQLRLLAPRLVSYECELETVMTCIETDDDCASGIIRYANRRQQDAEIHIDTVHHAVVYLGLIDAKQFLLNHILLDPARGDRAQQIQLLIRAKLVTDLFKTNGPLNKDLAFVGAYLAHKKLLNFRCTDYALDFFRLNDERHDAMANLRFGLRHTIEQAIVIETKCNPGSVQRRKMPREFEVMFHDAIYWANCILLSR